VTAKAHAERFRAILGAHEDGARFDVAHPLFAELFSLFARHPAWEEKHGCGVAYFSVGRDKWSGRCFYLHRVDGSSTDISFLRAASGKDLAPKTRTLCAMRRAIQAQCDKVHRPDGYHVDHVEPLEALAEKFLKANGYDWQHVSIVRGDGMYGVALGDRQFERDWQDFHREHAELRAIPALENLRKGNRRVAP
jgi:hypothetical protein